ncbi:MAG: hypothetical protein D6681_12620, partial [Calditrichaeota bacterium]
IWAGLPWFNQFWGRDSFISLTGALLCTGQLETARKVLTAFAEFQNQDMNSREYGRIPNRITLKESIYNTADGTPWFVIACEKYVQYSGDEKFIGDIFPVLKKAMDGAIKNHVDEYGFLTHADAETWMDAVGSAGPWSPRGNRAVEVQLLWMEQVRISREWAARLGYTGWADDWALLERRLRDNFTRFYWDRLRKHLTDHLNPDNTLDKQIRPNSVFALTLPHKPLLDSLRRQAVLREIVTQLTFPWGVASLAQQDPNFHPYHHYPPYYVPDAAYHNGLVWTWLNGPVVSALLPHNPELAFRLIQETSRQLLEENAVGSLAELTEAWPRKGATGVRTSGAISQAWSLAEYLRNWQEDILGLRPDLLHRRLHIRPILPAALNHLRFSRRIGRDILRGEFSHTGDEWRLSLSGKQQLPDLTIELRLPVGDSWIEAEFPWKQATSLTIHARREGRRAVVNVNGHPVGQGRLVPGELLTDLTFAQPTFDFSIPALQAPRYRLISPEAATRRPNPLTPLLYDIKDPAHDDVGPNGKYTYPTNPHFKEGIFDLRRVKIHRDKSYFFFEIEMGELVDPGWRPEPGFQLTYLAITLSFEGLKGVKRTRIGMNANYSLPVEYSYNYVIYVGNGYRIVDGRGRIVAEYQPTDTEHPIGFVQDRKIRFSVPVELLSHKHLKNAVVLAGGQDD